MELVSKGTLNASLVHPREVYKGAFLANANVIMVVHNQPSGNSKPSRAVKEVTTKLIQAGNITPLGDYNPDWAVVVDDTQKLYLVRETKSTLDRDKRRSTENKKVDCGKAHFKALGINFKDATTIYEVLNP